MTFLLFLEVLLANGLSRLAAVGGATWFLGRTYARAGTALLAIASGLLLAMPLTHLLPEAFEAQGADPHAIGIVMLCTVLVLVIAGRLVGTGHAHSGEPNHASDNRTAASIPALFCAVGIHNFVDGVLIATTFLVSESAGWLATAAVFAHELASQAGYLVILQEAGKTRRQAVLFCLLLAIPAVIGGICGLVAISCFGWLLPYALAMSAASFLFITLFALLPEVFEEVKGMRANLERLALILAGVVISVMLVGIAHEHDGEEHGHTHGMHALATHHDHAVDELHAEHED